MASGENDSGNRQIEAYIGLESEDEECGASICVEFDISIKVFIIAYALSLCEKENSGES